MRERLVRVALGMVASVILIVCVLIAVAMHST